MSSRTRSKSEGAKRRLHMDSDDEKIDDSVKDSPAKRGYLDGSASSFFSPQKKGKSETRSLITPIKKPSTKKVLTPGLDAEAEEEDIKPAPPIRKDQNRYVPEHLYKNLDYATSDLQNLSTGEQKAYRLITQYFNIPKDFEQSRRFGPWSGTCYEERVLAAYQVGQLKLIDSAVDICVSCGSEGHKKRDCPDLL